MAWCLAGLTVLALWPSLRLPWMLVDDAESLRRGMDALGRLAAVDLSGLVQTILEPESGRARPVYWLYQTAAYAVGGLSAPAHHGLRVGLAAATVAFASLAARAAGGRIAGWMTGLLLIGSPAYENWYRLGPVEPLLAGLLALILWNEWAREGRPGQSAIRTLGLAALMGTKETAVAVIVPAAAAGLGRSGSGRWRLLWSAGGWALVMMGLLAWVRQAGGGATYGGRAALGPETWSRIWAYASEFQRFYGGLPLVLIGTALAGGILERHRGALASRRRAQGVALSGFVAFLAPLGLWPDMLDRYLLPATVWLAVFSGLELAALANLARGSGWTRWAAAAGLVAAATCLKDWAPHSVGYIRDTARYQRMNLPNQHAVAWVARHAPRGGRVFVSHRNEEEITYEIRWHLALFYNRPDLAVRTFDFRGAARPGDIVLLHNLGLPDGILKRLEFYRRPVSRMEASLAGARFEPAGQWGLTFMRVGWSLGTSAMSMPLDNRWLAWRVVPGRLKSPATGFDLAGESPLLDGGLDTPLARSVWRPVQPSDWRQARAPGRTGLAAGSTVAWSWLDQEVPAVPGRVYHLSADVRQEDGPLGADNVFLTLEALGEGGRALARGWGILTAGRAWSRGESALLAPRGTQMVRVRLAKRLGDGRVWFDQVRLVGLEGVDLWHE